MKKYLLSILVISTYNLVDASPWFIMRNKTDFTMDMKVESSYKMNEADEIEHALSLDFNNKNITVECDHTQDLQGDNYLNLTVNFTIQPQSYLSIGSLLLDNEVACDVFIKSVTCVNHRLQLAATCDITCQKNRYIFLSYDEYEGIQMSITPIPMYVQCLYATKKIIQAAIATLLDATEWLPF